MDSKTKKRLLKEIQKEYKHPIDGGLIQWDEENIFKCHAIINGPEDTPYSNGFYIFEFDFSERNYPFKPPYVVFKTTGENTPQKRSKKLLPNCRFNPNLYETGKVCVSFLGTWAGPGWVSTMNTQSMFITLQSLLNDNPIQNEPGFEKYTKTSKQAREYNLIIKHANIRVAVLNTILNPPVKLTDEMREYINTKFLENYDKYIDICTAEEKCKYNKKVIRAPIYSWKEYIDFNFLKKQLKDVKKMIEEQQ